MRASLKQASARRAGFTLVEILVVISIIALLAAFLVPAVMSARQRATEAQVTVDINSLEAGLADFKATYGEYPPSRITLYSNLAGWNGTSPEARRSRTIIRRFWPRFDYASNGGLSLSANSVTLDGAECLVFFLGGIDDGSGLTGFSKNPATPFSTSGSRQGPFFEFKADRLKDGSLTGTANGFREYLDPIASQARPYIYYSSYEGAGYDTADKTGGLDHYTVGTSSVWKPKSFQIISPGFDTEYGAGGAYDPETANTVLTGPAREPERDNITNFSNGTLAD